MKTPDPLCEKLRTAVREHAMFKEDDAVLVAVSGGADSVSLLLALRETYPALRLYACHVDHGLRGEEARQDAAFVETLCESLSVPCEVLRADVGAIAKKEGVSTELAGRNVRYAFYKDVCRKYGVRLCATAHTATDNAETVLFRLMRGTGLAGLCGIPPVRALADGITLVRPLLYVTREDVEAYLAARGQAYRTDSTNAADDYTRNYIRNEVFPLLRKINPSPEQAVASCTDSLRAAQIFIEKTANNSLTDDIYALYNMDAAVRYAVLTALCRRDTGTSPMESVHVRRIAELIGKAVRERGGAYEVCLPEGISAKIKGDRLFFEKTVRRTAKKPEAYRYALSRGMTVIGETGYLVCVSDAGSLGETPGEREIAAKGYELCDCAVLEKEKIGGTLYARNRHDGDVIRQGGMSKKVKALLMREKIPCAERDAMPFITDENEILFLPGIAVNDTHKKALCTAKAALRVAVYRQKTGTGRISEENNG